MLDSQRTGSASDIIRITRSDPLLRAIRRLGLGPAGVYLTVLAFNTATNLIPAIILGCWDDCTLLTGLESPGLRGEPFALAVFALAQPMVFAYFVWVPSAIDSLFQHLGQHERLAPDPEVTSILRRARAILNHRSVGIISLVLASVVQGFVIYLEVGPPGIRNPTWIKCNWGVFSLSTLVAIPVYYALVILVLTWFVFVRALGQLARIDAIVIDPFAADLAGGLRRIGCFFRDHGLLAFSLAAAVSCLPWQAQIYGEAGFGSWRIASILAIGVFLLIAPVLFFLPLRSTHQTMKRQRDRCLQSVCRLQSAAYLQLMDTCAAGTPPSDRSMENARRLQDLADLTLRIPTWPFAFRDFARYYTLAMASPVLSLLIGVSVEWIAATLFSAPPTPLGTP